MKKKLIIFGFLMFLMLAVPVAIAAQTGTDDSEQTQTQTQEIQRNRTRTQTMEEFKEALEDLKEAKLGLRDQKREVVLEKVKELAQNRIQNIIERYERIELRVNKMKVITTEEKSRIADIIEEEISKMETQKNNVGGATSTAQVKVILAEVKLQVKSSVRIIKEIVQAIHVMHLNDIATRLGDVLDRLKTKVESLKTEGKDTTTMEGLLKNAQDSISEAKTKIAERDFKTAKENLLAARKSLVDLSQQIKAGGNVNQTEGGE